MKSQPLASPVAKSTSASEPASQQSSGQALQGEGNYDAARRHRESVEDFVDSGKVEEAAQDAAPKNQAEQDQMNEAERAGKAHSKGEDPALARGVKRTA